MSCAALFSPVDSVDYVADRIGPRRVSHVELPQGLAAGSVESKKVSFIGTAEYQASGTCEHRYPRRGQQLELPWQLSGGGLERANRAVGLLAGQCPNSPSSPTSFGSGRL